MLNKLEKYIIINNKRPLLTDKNIEIKQLSSWTTSQINNYKNNKYIMTNETIRK